ncbi:MAG: PadR family transcriptional regulator [Methanocorpusculum sp.]|jgi:DNA-binding PadR family transcriptional regulator|nr:PadR family transcriptional regulator [Methanocorpusculum sp.]MDD2470977.1 PadR family transcriptional regulator [Methanocorpusculum sp.]MDD4133361.1 PadR family transcriptional regulator [Methanocorpusculum sp.]
MTLSLEKSPLTEAAYYILLSLYEPMHGYGIMQNVKVMSCDRVNLGPGTLYGAISSLLEKGWIISAGEPDSRKKEYQITESGKKAVDCEIHRLEELLANGRKVTGMTS